MGSKLREIGARAGGDRPVPEAWRAGCTGKERFESAALADAVNRRRNTSRVFGDRDRRVGQSYRCRWCGGHHIGSALPSAPW